MSLPILKFQATRSTRPLSFDNFESYSDGSAVNTLNGGLLWNGAWVDRSNAFGNLDIMEDFESYSDGASITGQSGGSGWNNVWVSDSVDTPVASPLSGTPPQTVSLSTVLSGTSIYYTTNDTTPTTSSTLYTSPISISSNPTTLKAIAVKAGYGNSAVGSWTYGISAAATAALNDWVTRVQGVGSNVTISGTQVAVGIFIDGLMTDGVWSKIFRMNIYAGDGILALKAPLKYGGSFNTQDILNNFVSGDYSQSVGLTGDGSSKYILTGALTNDAPMGDNNVHLAVYCRTLDNGVTVAIGTTSSATTYLLPSFSGGSAIFVSNNHSTGLISGADTGGIGHYVGSRIASNNIALYKNGSLIGSGSGVAGSLSSLRHTVHAGNENNIIKYFTARTIEMYSMGTGLTATDALNFANRYSTLRTALGR